LVEDWADAAEPQGRTAAASGVRSRLIELVERNAAFELTASDRHSMRWHLKIGKLLDCPTPRATRFRNITNPGQRRGSPPSCVMVYAAASTLTASPTTARGTPRSCDGEIMVAVRRGPGKAEGANWPSCGAMRTTAPHDVSATADVLMTMGKGSSR